MAEPVSLTVVSLIAGGFLAEAGSGTWRSATRIANFLRRKFGSDQTAVGALQQCEEAPTDESTRSNLRAVIDRYLDGDSQFREDLLSTLESEGYSRDEVQNNRVAVSDHANVGKIVQIKSVQGDVSF
ncbi:hypothetical protein ABZ669_00505 [Streptomyces hirsutus]|uniref:hypothetical protein n=1 Tax=Streptomyces hirsutus TaxID=35620 RepID=UPI0033D59E5C